MTTKLWQIFRLIITPKPTTLLIDLFFIVDLLIFLLFGVIFYEDSSCKAIKYRQCPRFLDEEILDPLKALEHVAVDVTIPFLKRV